jgi:hypothetical protein
VAADARIKTTRSGALVSVRCPDITRKRTPDTMSPTPEAYRPHPEGVE